MGHLGRAGRTALKFPARAGPVVALLAYLGAAVLLGALLAYPVFVVLEQHADPAFDSVLHRIAALSLLLLLPLYLASGRRETRAPELDRSSGAVARHGTRSTRARRARVSRQAFGFGCSRRTFRRGFCGGFVLGILVVSPLIAAFLVLGVRAPVQAVGSVADIGVHLASALVAAAIIGVIEEAYFRGALLTPLQGMPAWLAVSIVSAVYAVMHFLGAPLAEEPSWRSGLESIARSEIPLDAFLALVAAGLFLGALRYRFGHIAVGAGFHAGWVWIMKLTQEYTDVVHSSEWAFLEGEFGGTMGYLGLVWIALIGAAWLVVARRSSRAGTLLDPISRLHQLGQLGTLARRARADPRSH